MVRGVDGLDFASYIVLLNRVVQVCNGRVCAIVGAEYKGSLLGFVEGVNVADCAVLETQEEGARAKLGAAELMGKQT